MIENWLEKNTVHAPSAGGLDYTLCGAALEGERGDTPMLGTYAKIDCKDCVGIILFCKKIQRREFVCVRAAPHDGA